MNILVLNKEFEAIKNLNIYHSLIWTVRYSENGDFELYTPLTVDISEYIVEGYYLYLRDSDRLMIIEDIEIATNPEDGSFLVVTGRSLVSILSRRIIWNETVLTGSLQNGIFELLNENVIAPEIESRRIPNFVFEMSDDPYIVSKTIEAQYWGEDLYETIKEICVEEKIGFMVTLTEDNRFIFKLFKGVDRSYSQLVNPYVVFSPDFENLKNSTYLESFKPYKNVSLIKGEQLAKVHIMETVDLDNAVGINRREIFTDAGNVSSEIDGVSLSDPIYKTHLKQKGKDDLNEHKAIKILEGNADFSKTFKLGIDFNIGDIVQLKNEQGFESRVVISEIIFVQDMSGYRVYPTFTVEEEEIL